MWQIRGQDKIVALLERSIEAGSIAHAYLLVGPRHVGKGALALNVARRSIAGGQGAPAVNASPAVESAKANMPTSPGWVSIPRRR